MNPKLPIETQNNCTLHDSVLFVISFRFQIFVFSLNPKNEDWRFYNWDKVTTVVMVGYLDMKVVCQAHKYGARAITIGKYIRFSL